MIQIWKIDESGETLISVQADIANAEYFCEKNNIKNYELFKVLD